MGRIFSKPPTGEAKFRNLSDAKQAIITDYAQNQMAPRALYAKYCKLIGKPFSLGTLRVMLNDWGATKLKRAVDKKIGRMRSDGTLINASTFHTEEMIENAADVIAQKITEGRTMHTGRMVNLTDRVFKVIEKEEPTQKTLPAFIDNLTRADALCRKLYRIDDAKPLDGHQVQVAVLVNLARED